MIATVRSIPRRVQLLAAALAVLIVGGGGAGWYLVSGSGGSDADADLALAAPRHRTATASRSPSPTPTLHAADQDKPPTSQLPRDDVPVSRSTGRDPFAPLTPSADPAATSTGTPPAVPTAGPDGGSTAGADSGGSSTQPAAPPSEAPPVPPPAPPVPTSAPTTPPTTQPTSAPTSTSTTSTTATSTSTTSTSTTSSSTTTGTTAPTSSTAPTSTTATAPSTSYKFLGLRSDGTPKRWDVCRAIGWRLNPANAPAGAQADVARALEIITADTGMTFTYLGTTTYIGWTSGNPAPPDSNAVEFSWADESTVPQLAGGVVGLGGSWWDSTGTYFKGAITMDVVGEVPGGFASSPGSGQILLHEMGHVLGLDHVDDATQMMNPILKHLPSVDYQAGDRAGLAILADRSACS